MAVWGILINRNSCQIYEYTVKKSKPLCPPSYFLNISSGPGSGLCWPGADPGP